MNRRAFLKHLRANGCDLHRRGARHDIWINPATGEKAAVPRHRTVSPGVVRSVCRQLAVPEPGGS